MLREQRYEIFETMGGDPFEEGANLDIHEIFKDNCGKMMSELKNISKLIKSEDYKNAKKKIKDCKTLVKKVTNDVRKVESTTGSAVFGLLLSGQLMFIGRYLVGMIIPYSGFVLNIATLVERVNVLLEESDKRGKIDLKDDFNLYKNSVLVRLKEYDKCLDVLDKVIDKKIKESK